MALKNQLFYEACNRTSRVTVLLLLTSLLAACAALLPNEPPIPALADHAAIAVPAIDLLRTTPEMREFARQYTQHELGNRGRAWKLAYAALDPNLLVFDYDALVTLPADEAFRTGRGNCLTFSGMVIALARAAGLSAWFQEVIMPPEWSDIDGTLLVSKHVNAVVAEGGRRYTIDVSRSRKTPLSATRRLSDEEALAQYYNNLGAESLLRSDLPRAHAYFNRALKARGGLAYIWSNLGVLLRRNGQTEDAALAYRTAIRLDPSYDAALNNLHTLYVEEGNLEAAAAIERRVEHNRRNNPYYLHHLAQQAGNEERWADALELVSRAIDLEANDYRFHFTQAQANHFAGHADAARASLQRARELAPAYLPGGSLELPDQSR